MSSLTSAGLEEFKHLVNEATLRRKALSQSLAELTAAERRLRNAQRFFLRLFYSKAKTLRLADDVQGKQERQRDAPARLDVRLRPTMVFASEAAQLCRPQVPASSFGSVCQSCAAP